MLHVRLDRIATFTMHCLLVLEQHGGKVYVLYLGQSACSIVLCANVLQFDDPLDGVVSYHLVAKVNVFRLFVGHQVVGHTHSTLVVHLHGEVDM